MQLRSILRLERIDDDQGGFYQCLITHEDLCVERQFSVEVESTSDRSLKRTSFSFELHPTAILFEPDETSPIDFRCQTHGEACRTRWMDESHQPINVSSIDQLGFYQCETCCETRCRTSSSFIYPVRFSSLNDSSRFDFRLCLDARREEMKHSFVRFLFYFFSKRRSVDKEYRKLIGDRRMKDGTNDLDGSSRSSTGLQIGEQTDQRDSDGGQTNVRPKVRRTRFLLEKETTKLK